MRAPAPVVAMLACALGGCLTPEQPTALVLVADTDMGFLDGVTFDITGPDGTQKTAHAPMDDAHPPPFFVSMVRETSRMGPFLVIAKAMLSDQAMVTRSAEVWFSRGETLVVPLHLVWDCHDSVCTSDRPVCTEHGCQAEAMARSELETWTGAPPRLDDREIIDQDPITGEDPVDAGDQDPGGEEGPIDQDPVDGDQDPVDGDQDPIDAGHDAGPPDNNGRDDAGTLMPVDAGLDDGRD